MKVRGGEGFWFLADSLTAGNK